MSLLGLLGRGFGTTGGGGGSPIAAPGLAVVDSGDGTGAIATITGGDAEAENTIKTAAVSGTARTLEWIETATRTGNGTVVLDLEPGNYVAVVVAEKSGAFEISNLVEFSATSAADGTFTFDKLRNHVLVNRTLNTDFFGELVTFKRQGVADRQLTAHCKHTIRYAPGDEGGEQAVEQITVTINKADLASEPKRGDRIQRAGESQPYLYAFGGKSEKQYWRVTFERRKVLAQG